MLITNFHILLESNSPCLRSINTILSQTRSHGTRTGSKTWINTLTMASMRRHGGTMPERCSHEQPYHSSLLSGLTYRTSRRCRLGGTPSSTSSYRTSSVASRIQMPLGPILSRCPSRKSSQLAEKMPLQLKETLLQPKKSQQLRLWSKWKSRSQASSTSICTSITWTCLR